MKNCGYKIPNRRTFRHWENIRIDNKTLRVAMNLLIIELRKALEKYGETLGKKIWIDSTPLESLFNDKDAKYSGHYEKTGYKIHEAYDPERNIPLAIIVTPMNKGDSPYFKTLIQQLHDLGIKFEKVFSDGAYDSYNNFALIHVTHNSHFYTNLGNKAVFNENGTIERINYEYNKLWNKKDFSPLNQVILNDKIKFLMKYGKTEIVGA